MAFAAGQQRGGLAPARRFPAVCRLQGRCSALPGRPSLRLLSRLRFPQRNQAPPRVLQGHGRSVVEAEWPVFRKARAGVPDFGEFALSVNRHPHGTTPAPRSRDRPEPPSRAARHDQGTTSRATIKAPRPPELRAPHGAPSARRLDPARPAEGGRVQGLARKRVEGWVFGGAADRPWDRRDLGFRVPQKGSRDVAEVRVARPPPSNVVLSRPGHLVKNYGDRDPP